ncbi:hypothetical protein CsSME_00036807 [Camellia sinensis var. sinensis]
MQSSSKQNRWSTWTSCEGCTKALQQPENMHGHQVQRSNLWHPMTVLRRRLTKTARTVAGCPPFQPAAQHEHTVQHTVAQEDGTPATVHAASSGINANDTPTSGMNKRKSPGPTHPQRKRGQSEGASLLASSMENLASSVKLQQRQIRVSHDYADSAQHLIQKCMTRLYSLEGLDPQDPLVPFAQLVLENPVNQAIMMSIPTDTAIIAWLRTKKSREQCIGGPSAANSGMGSGWF